jgi:hypothetical protein
MFSKGGLEDVDLFLTWYLEDMFLTLYWEDMFLTWYLEDMVTFEVIAHPYM